MKKFYLLLLLCVGSISVFGQCPAAPAIGGGTSPICVTASTTLTDATTGGSWTSSNTSIATVGLASGVVTGVAPGNAVITYTTACGSTTTVTVTVAALPTNYAVTGGGGYCAGGTGVHVGLNSSASGTSYVLYNGATSVSTLSGTGSALDYGLVTSGGTYTIVATAGGCSATMSGSAIVTVNPLPTAFTVGGGGAYCSGGSGVNVTLSSSSIGVNYQLMLGSTPIGSAVVGTSGALSFGPATAAGTYTVTATNASTGCTNTMAGSSVVSINSLPTAFTVTGGGGYCLGGTGVHIGLSGSATGVTYQLQISGSPVGSALSGTGSSLDFGLITTGGVYTVLATNTASGCQMTMSGTDTVTVNPLPTVFTVTGGGAYCFGGTGSAVGLNGSTIGVNYQLYNGSSTVGSPVAGTGVAISFGLQTLTGSYSVVATNATTGCVSNMFGSALVSTNPLPSVFTVTGGGGYCAGGPGVHIGLSSSVAGTTYYLYSGTTLVGALSGTGSAIDFGLYTSAGAYTVNGINGTTGCAGNMSGSATIVINTLPTVYTVTGGGSYCAGGTGLTLGLNNSTTGVNYQLYNGATAVGSLVPGTGSSISFGLQTGAGSYTVIGANATTTCSNNMSGSAVITINPLPTIYAVTGGGSYCIGSTGVHVGLAASNTGINYQLYNGGIPGTTLAGSGFSLDYGSLTTAGTYTVTATNPATGCSTGMSGSALIVVNALPAAYPVIGGGSYCAGGTGVIVSLGSSASGINYQLFNGATPMGAPVAGTGSALSLGLQTAAGTYTAVAYNAATGCSNNMTGSASVSINPLPAVYAITGGGAYCAGGAGVNVGIGGSVVGTSYQLYNGVATVGSAMTGTGAPINFGLQTAAGTYAVTGTITATGCSASMTGSTTVSINPLPATNTITGGGSYCTGGAGVHIGLNGSVIGISYQLYNGTSPVGSPLVGTTLPLDFGLQTSGGSYTITGSNMITGCQSTMLGTASVTVNPLPVSRLVTGGGNYCVGGSGISVGVNGSSLGTNYQLYNGTSPVGAPVAGTNFALSFGPQTALGIYTVIATNTTTGCSGNMTGSATIGTYPLPVVYNVTGGGSYCSGGTGVHIGLSGSNTGVTYQLWNGSFSAASVAGSGLAINFGLLTAPGTYTVTATSTATGCTGSMSGSAVVGVNALPAPYTVTGGGDYCSGGAGVSVGLSGSDAGISYQLLNGTPTGIPVSGGGSTISFGPQTAAGTYTVLAVNPSTTCTNTMTGSVNVTIDPLPTAYPVSGGGHYCSGGTGVNISMTSSDAGTTYQLWSGTTAVGLSQAGPGVLSFGSQTAAGTYTVVGTTTATGCTNNMGNTVTVSIDPLPTTYIVTGGGAYCAGTGGVHVMLSGSNSGVSYQLMNSGAPSGPALPGTGMALDFGPQTAGGTYTVAATNNTTLCMNIMTGSVNVTVNALPTLYNVSSTSSTYCAGGGGVDIWLNSSDAGVSYQLYNGSTTSGIPLAGTGASIDFGHHFIPGSYRVTGVNNTTGCVDTMTSGVTIVVNPLPSVYAVTGGGSYCSGSGGLHVGLSGSNTGIMYQLMIGSVPSGSAIPGTGGPLDFGLRTTAGNYTVVATNPATTCTNTMSGSVTIAINSLPAVYTVLGGGIYCAGGAGRDISLSSSALAVNYQLYVGSTAVGVPLAGSGVALDFGMQTAAGAYTVAATNTITGCTSNMAGSQNITINPAPPAFAVIGGGSYCPGGPGVHIGVGGSTAVINYQLYNGGTATGSALIGSGSPLDFGLQTAAGTYTVIATNTATGCTGAMSGSAAVVISPLPGVYTVMGGGSYCAGGAGVHVGLSNSEPGVNYKLINSFTTVTVIPGTGSPLDFGLQTAAGTYTVQAVNATTGCSSDMSGSAAVTVSPLVTPLVSVSSNHGDTVCQGTFTTFTASAVNSGSSPAYQWAVNGAPSSVGASYGYVPSDGDVVSVTLTSSAMCAIPSTASASVTMSVLPNESPVVTVTAHPGTVVCQGSSVTFTANPAFAGSTPTYAWYKNGNFTVSTPSYTYTPGNGDVVFCVMTGSYRCALSNTATSSHLTMEVDVATLPVVTITAHPGNSIAPGQSVTLDASVVNGGPAPTYQWLVNGIPVPGATQPSFVSNSFNDGDSATCEVVSSGGCAGNRGFNSISIRVHGTGVQQLGAAGSSVLLVPNPSKGVFTVKGTLGATTQDVTIEITDILGQVVYTSKKTISNGALSEHVDLGSKAANGMYLLSLRSEAGTQVFHVVVAQ